jgi:phage-related protein
MFWEAKQYESVWDDVYSRCDTATRITIDHRLDSLCEKGNLSREPVSKLLDDGIFELRGKDARFLFYFGESRTIIFVHALIKKRADVPRKDINLAKSRRDDIKLLELKTNAVSN